MGQKLLDGSPQQPGTHSEARQSIEDRIRVEWASQGNDFETQSNTSSRAPAKVVVIPPPPALTKQKSTVDPKPTPIVAASEPGPQRIPIFECYFYPEFVIKPETAQKECLKVQFIGMKELEKERIDI